MRWFKMFTEARNDSKLRSLSDSQHRTWFNLLCFAAEQRNRGIITGLSLHHVAVETASGDRDLLVSTLEALQALQGVTWRYIDVTDTNSGVEIVFVKFAERQKPKPSDDNGRVRERVAKSRQIKRSKSTENGIASVTPCNAPCNAPVTLGNAYKEGDTEGEEEKNPPSPLSVKSPPVRSPEEMLVIRRAMDLLGSDPHTESLAIKLGREQSTNGALMIPAWKFLRAAEKIQEPGYDDEQRRNFKYFLGIAKNLRDSERYAKAPSSHVSYPASNILTSTIENFSQRLVPPRRK